MKTTRAQRAISWIEKFCVYPGGPLRGQFVHLSQLQRDTIHAIYEGDGLKEPVSGPLAAFVALLHLCGPEFKNDVGFPPLAADIFSVWNATSEKLRDVLKREGATITCPEIGTRYPPQAA